MLQTSLQDVKSYSWYVRKSRLQDMNTR